MGGTDTSVVKDLYVQMSWDRAWGHRTRQSIHSLIIACKSVNKFKDILISLLLCVIVLITDSGADQETSNLST